MVLSEQAPYRVTMSEVVERFGFSLERIQILEGLLSYREKMRSIHITGYQWLDGSFVEDCEQIRGRSPADIDIVTFAYRPLDQYGNHLNIDDFLDICDANDDLFSPEKAKAAYMCDAYYVDFHQEPHLLAGAVTYWCNLFSHSREHNLWKGILQVELRDVDDSEAKAILHQKKAELLAAQGRGE